MSEEKESVESQEEKKFFDGIDLTPYRKEGESPIEYKARRDVNNKLMRAYKKGKRVYNAKHIINAPKIENGEIVIDEEGKMVETDQKIIMGPYNKKLMGKLPD